MGMGAPVRIALVPVVADDHGHPGGHPGLGVGHALEAGDLGLQALGGGVGGVERPVAIAVVDPVVDTLDRGPHPGLARAGVARPVGQHHRGRRGAAPHGAAVGVDHLRALGHGQDPVPQARVAGRELADLVVVAGHGQRRRPHRGDGAGRVAEQAERELESVAPQLVVEDQGVDGHEPVVVALGPHRVAGHGGRVRRPDAQVVALGEAATDPGPDQGLDPRPRRRRRRSTRRSPPGTGSGVAITGLVASPTRKLPPL